MKLFIVISILLFVHCSVYAVEVPEGCIELAKREGFNTGNLTESEAKKAKRRLYWLRIRHPKDQLVEECILAIKKR